MSTHQFKQGGTGCCAVCDDLPGKGEHALKVKPEYVYVASSWRCNMQEGVIEILKAAHIPAYDFKNPEGGTGFSWKEVRTQNGPTGVCEHCLTSITYSTFAGLGFWEPDFNPNDDPIVWRHTATGYAACLLGSNYEDAIPMKGSDWEKVDEYMSMISHPRAIEGYNADFAAMNRADTFVLVLPCGKSAHLELGWAVGAGKRTAILMEDPIEPELMYKMVDHLSPSVMDLLDWLGVED